MLNKQNYIKFAEKEQTLPIFSQPWWLDVACGKDNWGVSIVMEGDDIAAVCPYYTYRKKGFLFLGQPVLTPFLGPWYKPKANAKYPKLLSREKKLLQELEAGLPDCDIYQQNWQSTRINWLPFFWKGYNQTSRVTYRIECLDDLDVVYAGFQGNIKTDIRKAEKLNVEVVEASVDDFLSLNEKVFTRQDTKMPYSKEFIHKLDSACAENSSRKIFLAKDQNGNHHAAVYIVWDSESAYYLMGGGDAGYRSSGATSLCLWEAIKFSSTVTKQFDFEGSMMEPVEKFVRAFGGRQIQYNHISKVNSKLLKLIKAIR